MNHLRSLEAGDIPQVVRLRRRVFGQSEHRSDTTLGRYYHTLFFENPWHDKRYPSLIQEDADGEILGFVGAIPRPMLFGTERITAVTSTELMVTPEARGLVGPKLLRRLFDGPQHLTYSDRSNDQARALYEGLGGSAALWYSLYWSVSINGARISYETAAGGTPRSAAARALSFASRSLDRLSNASMTHNKIATQDEPLAPETVMSLMRRLAGKNTLVPEYETHSFSWLIQRLSETEKSRRVVTAQVIHGDEPIGWFIYVIRPDGEIDLVQMAALPGREGMTLDHLIYHARAEGGTVLRGRLDRRFAPLISQRGLPLTLGQPWTVVQASRSDVATQFLAGNAFFSRLDAEWWIGA